MEVQEDNSTICKNRTYNSSSQVIEEKDLVTLTTHSE